MFAFLSSLLNWEIPACYVIVLKIRFNEKCFKKFGRDQL